MSNELLTCAICGAQIKKEEANNPDPIIKDDTSVCCRKCNYRFVLPARGVSPEGVREIERTSKQYEEERIERILGSVNWIKRKRKNRIPDRELFEGAFEAFLDDHKEFTKEHADLPESPHTPKYKAVNTSAEEEFNVYSVLKVLSDKEMLFAYRLLQDISTRN